MNTPSPSGRPNHTPPGSTSWDTTWPIVPPKYVKQVGDAEYNIKPVGSGPYKLTKWVKGEEIAARGLRQVTTAPKPAYKKVIFKAASGGGPPRVPR